MIIYMNNTTCTQSTTDLLIADVLIAAAELQTAVADYRSIPAGADFDDAAELAFEELRSAEIEYDICRRDALRAGVPEDLVDGLVLAEARQAA